MGLVPKWKKKQKKNKNENVINRWK